MFDYDVQSLNFAEVTETEIIVLEIMGLGS